MDGGLTTPSASSAVDSFPTPAALRNCLPARRARAAAPNWAHPPLAHVRSRVCVQGGSRRACRGSWTSTATPAARERHKKTWRGKAAPCRAYDTRWRAAGAGSGVFFCPPILVFLYPSHRAERSRVGGLPCPLPQCTPATVSCGYDGRRQPHAWARVMRASTPPHPGRHNQIVLLASRVTREHLFSLGVPSAAAPLVRGAPPQGGMSAS